MSLPVSLIGTLVSIVPSVSPNEITSNPDSSNSPTISIGLIDAVSNDISLQVSAGQYVWYKDTEDKLVVCYLNKNYTIIDSKYILFIENQVTPP